MSKTLGVALGSGGSRGIAHIGFLCALEDEGIKPDFIAGSSIGAVVGGCYASGTPAYQLKEIALKLRRRDLLDPTIALSKMGLLRSKKVRDLLLQYLGNAKIEDFEIPFKCVASDLYSGHIHIFDRGEAAIAIQASSAIPAVFRPVRFNDKLLVDGGCLCRIPVRTVKEMGADVVVGVDVLKNCAEPVDDVKNIVSVVVRAFEIMDQRITDINRELERDICDVLIEPALDGVSQYAIRDFDRIFDEGYAVARKSVGRIKALLTG